MKSKITILGNILTVAALLLIIRKIGKMDLNWSAVFDRQMQGVFLISLFLYTVMMALCTIPWTELVAVFTGEAVLLKKNKLILCYTFLKANVFKYIPGNVFQYIGRNEIALRLNLNHADIAMASVAEVMIITVISLAISVFTVGSYTVAFFTDWLRNSTAFLIIVCAVLIAAFVILRRLYSERISQYLKRIVLAIKAPNSPKLVFSAALFYIFSFTVNTFVFVMILNQFKNVEMTARTISILIGSYVLSWLIGYITPGAPGGIGVRELVLVAILTETGTAVESTIVQAAVTTRLITIVGDLLAFLGVLLFRWLFRKAADTKKTDLEGDA